MRYIAPAIEGFPIPTDEYGELLTDDYQQALIEARAWLTANENYRLEMETY